jgi:hyperosmotically inducible periplasmic protein
MLTEWIRRDMKRITSKALAVVAVLVIGASAAFSAPAEKSSDKGIGEKVRKELVTLPYYGIFDNLAYKVDGSTVHLYGQVVRPSTKSDAERRVSRINGVSRVVNNIEVLPLSSFDDSIRRDAYRTIFRFGSLYRYAMGANPSIHLIVNRGHLTLEGVVGSEGDRNLANIAARSVPGVFSVTNHLQVEGRAR